MEQFRGELPPFIESERTPYRLTVEQGYRPTDPDASPQLDAVRAELSSLINPIVPEGGEIPPVIITGESAPAEGPLGILQEKDMKKRAKERKDKQPQGEMLVVFNDVQLIRSTDQEALGAFLKYVETNKDKITHLVANGDIVDFEAQSVFAKGLDALNIAPDEIEATKWLIQRLSNLLPHAKKVFIEGNHEARWGNMIDDLKGNGAWIKTPDEMFGFTENGWDLIPYGSGRYFEWHERIFWHGHRAGTKSNVPKLEMDDAGTSVTTAHINRNMFHERVDARGNYQSGMTHGGFSRDNLGFMKKANTGWSQGFGVYYWDKKVGEQPYMIIMKHGNPRFIGPDGNIYDGAGFSIPGFEEQPRRKRRR